MFAAGIQYTLRTKGSWSAILATGNFILMEHALRARAQAERARRIARDMYTAGVVAALETLAQEYEIRAEALEKQAVEISESAARSRSLACQVAAAKARAKDRIAAGPESD